MLFRSIASGGLTLKSLHTDFIYNGTVAHVVEINEDFFLDKSSTATPDDVTVVQPASGPGRWIRRVTSNLRGLTLSTTPPDDGYVLAWNQADGYWEPKSPSAVGVQLSGDLSGSSSSVTVVGLQGHSVSSTAPTDGYVLTWDGQGNSWQPKKTENISLSGDLSGRADSVTVVGLQGHHVSSAAPSDGYALFWNNTDGYWQPKSPSAVGVQLSGDLSGTSKSASVVALQGHSVSSDAPSDGYVLTWDGQGNSWQPKKTGSISLSGDLSGTSTNVTVSGIQGHAISSAAPSDGYVLMWAAASNTWAPQKISQGSYLRVLSFDFLSAVVSVSDTVFTNIGAVNMDVSKLSPAQDNGTRTIKLKALVQTNGTTAEIILYNLTTGTTISLNQPSISLTASSTSPYLLESQDLSQLLTNGPAQYEARIRQTTSNGTTDQVICQMCKLEVEWSAPQ